MDKRAQQRMVVQPMQIGDVRPLFPLVQAQDAGLTWLRWQSYAKRVVRSKLGAREGILVARRSGHALPCGAVCYRIDRDLRFGRILTVEHVIALDLLYPQLVRSALTAALERLAVELGCDIIRSIVPANEAEVAEELRRAGHSEDGRTLTKHCRPDTL
ncbi:MAG TPA: hypothetical protein VL752_13870 [Acidisoma sp.]|uniref:hypothetical protein n=1 Tax=Acidisoma sp. TaxID=1872115 RepID=UPI002BE74623|nr:hypothetical protein [Acidisoma sp.]HTI02030.1 hypothetical protein [Acidisoma sp.]